MGCTESTDNKAESQSPTTKSPDNQRSVNVAEHLKQQHDSQVLPADHVTGLGDLPPASATDAGQMNMAVDFRRSTPSPPPHEFLTDIEKSIILRDWSRLQQCDFDHQREMGMRIFLRIFELSPSARLTFSKFRDLADPTELAGNAMFRAHASRFMIVVAGVVDNLDDLDVIVVPNLVQLGKIHRIVAGEPLLRDHFDAFEQAMTEVWGTELRSRQCNIDRQLHKQEESITRTAGGFEGKNHDSGTPNGTGNGKISTSLAPDGDFDDQSKTAWLKLFHWITSRVLDGYFETSRCKSNGVQKTASADGHPAAVVHLDKVSDEENARPVVDGVDKKIQQQQQQQQPLTDNVFVR